MSGKDRSSSFRQVGLPGVRQVRHGACRACHRMVNDQRLRSTSTLMENTFLVQCRATHNVEAAEPATRPFPGEKLAKTLILSVVRILKAADRSCCRQRPLRFGDLQMQCALMLIARYHWTKALMNWLHFVVLERLLLLGPPGLWSFSGWMAAGFGCLLCTEWCVIVAGPW